MRRPRESVNVRSGFVASFFLCPRLTSRLPPPGYRSLSVVSGLSCVFYKCLRLFGGMGSFLSLCTFSARPWVRRLSFSLRRQPLRDLQPFNCLLLPPFPPPFFLFIMCFLTEICLPLLYFLGAYSFVSHPPVILSLSSSPSFFSTPLRLATFDEA